MKIICVNIERGLYSQYYHILQILGDKSICVLCILEPKLNKHDYVPEFDSFKAFYLDKYKLIIYVKQNVGLTCMPIWQGMPCFVVVGNQLTMSFCYSEFTKVTLEGKKLLSKKERLSLIKETYGEILRTSHNRHLAMGDFNFCNLKKENCTYVKQFLNFFKRNEFVNQVEGITRFAKIEGQEDSQLDYCWTRNLIGTAEKFLFSNSDHMGICFEIPSNEKIRLNPKFRISYKETESTKNFLKNNQVEGCVNFNDEMARPLERNFEDLTNFFGEMRKTMKVEKKYCELDVPWWNNKLASLKRIIRREKNLHYKKELHKQYLYWFNFYHRRWVIKNVTSKKHPFPKSSGEKLSRLVVNGEELTSDKDLSEAMRDSYINKVEKNFEESNPNWGVIIDRVKEYVAGGENENIDIDEQGSPIPWDIPIPNEKDIEQVIDGLKAKDSVGITDVSYRMIKIAKRNVLRKITIIARQSLLFGKMADVWHQIIGIPVHKKGRDSTICNSFRIVALQDNLLKIIGLYVCNFITWKFESMSLFADFVIGFRKGFSTDDYTFKLIEMIHEAKAANKALGVASSDLKSAYDLTSKSYVLDILQALGAGPRLRHWFKALYGKKDLRVRLNDFTSEPREIMANLLQGDPSSPILFNLALFPIKFFVKTRLLQYADDIHITAMSEDAEKAKEELLQYYNEYDDFVNKTGLVSEHDKLEFKIWGKGSTKKEVQELDCNGHKLKMKESIRILGLHLNSKLDFTEDVEDLITKLRQRAGMIRIQGKHLPMRYRMQLYQGWINSKINFGMRIYLPMLTKEKFKQLKEATNQGFRAAAGLMRKSTQCITEIRSRHKCASFYQVARDSIERIAFKVMKSLHEKDRCYQTKTRSLTKGVMKKHVNLHVRSLERFYREFVNEFKIFEFQSLKDLRKFQEGRLREEFENAAHFDVNRKDHRVLEFERTRCGIRNIREKANKTTRISIETNKKERISKMNRENAENNDPNAENGNGEASGTSQAGNGADQVETASPKSKYNNFNVDSE